MRLASEVTPELLRGYDLVLMLAQRSEQATRAVAGAMSRARVVFLGPAAAASRTARARFATRARHLTLNREAELLGADGRSGGALFVRDDVLALRPAPGVEVRSWLRAGGISLPVLLRRGNDWWLNAFSADDRLLAPLFAGVYGRRLEQGIMFGEGFRSQRLEITREGSVFQNTFEAPAAFEHEPLPVPWSPPPAAGVR